MHFIPLFNVMSTMFSFSFFFKSPNFFIDKSNLGKTEDLAVT